MTLYETDMSDTSDSYATKPQLWRPIADAINGFDVDPASGAESKKIADTVYTKEDDGLSQTWNGKVWLNPPFSEKKEWLRKAVKEVNVGNADVVVALAPVDTSTKWFQRWFSKAEIICWLSGRNWYVSNGSPSFNTHVGVFGTKHIGDIEAVLQSKGIVTKVEETHEQKTLC